MSVCIYARVSTDDQTLEQQEAACRRLIDPAKDGNELTVIREKAPGWDFDGRRGYSELQSLVARRAVKTIIVFKLDRLGRGAKQVYDFVCECESRGIGLRSVHDQLDSSTPMGRAIIVILATVAEMERDNIKVRTRAVFQHYREEFNYRGHGSMAGWFSAKAIQLEPYVRALVKQGFSAWGISCATGLDHRTVKRMLAAPEGTLKTKKQLHKENPGWYLTPAEQRKEFLLKKAKGASRNKFGERGASAP